MSTGPVLPAYGDRSLADVLPAVAGALGHPGAAGPTPTGLDLPPASSYVVFLVDGLGANLLREHAHVAPYLGSLLARQEPGTCGVPSTTATSLTSLGTGLAPGGHGVVGFTSRIPGTDRVLNSLFWDSSVDPREWQPEPTAFERLTAAGAPVTVVNKRDFEGSGLTVAAHRGGEYVGADGHAERLAAVSAASQVPGSLTFMYDSDLDHAGHRFGTDSSEWLQQLSVIDSDAEQVRESLGPSTRLVVVADHGMVDCSPEDRTDVDQHPHLRRGVQVLAGEARFRHLYVRDGALDDVVSVWREHFGELADVRTRDEALSAGWFGAADDRTRPRLGDVVVAARGSHGIFSSRDFGYEMSLVGLHGSMTPDEMLIPILVD